ncbi:hypothetical protein GN316_03035 [Xylophilus sp. Kf1]|nr:hypothetical protein [Xylophilus sp. Kf1]
MSKNETYLVMALIAWVAFQAGRNRGLAIGLASANVSAYPSTGTDWLTGWGAS